jgi:A/G-specific adenine glycosylase
MSRVLPAYERFIAAFPTVEALAASSTGDVIRVWTGMGYNQRAVRLHRAARQIAASGWPRTAADFARIDGIGPFTAAIVASFAFGEPAACVDTNVRRVLGRVAGDESLNGRALQALADTAIVGAAPARWNQALMDYGARICTPRPACDACVVRRWCASRKRHASPAPKVADQRAAYAAVPRKKREPPYEGSRRFFRGRIIDALRALPPGASLRIDELPARIANGHSAPTLEETRALVEALERHGLAIRKGGRVSLPG